MSYSLSYHQVDHSKAFEKFLKLKLESFSRLLRGVDIDFIVNRDAREFVFCAHSRSGKDFYFKSSSPSLYKAAGSVLRKVIYRLKN